MSRITKEKALARIDAALEVSAKDAHIPKRRDAFNHPIEENEALERAAIVVMKATIDDLAISGSVYREEADRAMVGNFYGSARVSYLEGVLAALRTAYENDYLASVEGLVEAGIFTDFLEMASELLEKGYKDPAAVVVGSVLEEHLRSLARPLGVPVESSGSFVKTSKLSDDLVKAGAYDKQEAKQVLAWLGLRNDAAHGHYEKYDRSQVDLMLQGVRAFMLRYPTS